MFSKYETHYITGLNTVTVIRYYFVTHIPIALPFKANNSFLFNKMEIVMFNKNTTLSVNPFELRLQGFHIQFFNKN